jgi:hypothetical protein
MIDVYWRAQEHDAIVCTVSAIVSSFAANYKEYAFRRRQFDYTVNIADFIDCITHILSLLCGTYAYDICLRKLGTYETWIVLNYPTKKLPPSATSSASIPCRHPLLKLSTSLVILHRIWSIAKVR